MNSWMVLRNEPSPNRIIRSKHDSLMVRTKRSAWAFRFGERGGSFTGCTPVVASVSRNSAVNNGSRTWIRYLFPDQEAFGSVSEIACQAHPESIGLPGQSGDLHPSARQVD